MPEIGRAGPNIVKNSSKAGPRIASLPNVFKAFRKRAAEAGDLPKSGPCVSLTKGFKPKIAKAKKGARGKKAYGNFKRRWNFGQWGLGDKKWAGIRHTGYLNIEGNTEKLQYHLHSSMPVDFFDVTTSTRLTSKSPVPRSDSSLTPRSPSVRLVIGADLPRAFSTLMWPRISSPRITVGHSPKVFRSKWTLGSSVKATFRAPFLVKPAPRLSL